jgi:hypothetical protein
VRDEDFTSAQQGWLDDARHAWLDAAGYHLFAREAGRFVAVGTPAREVLGDAVVSAEFRKVGGPPGGGYGLILRDQAPGQRDGSDQGGRYYVFEVGDRGEVGIWRRDGDHWVDLVPWTPVEAVRPGSVANDLTAQAIGSHLSLAVNGVSVASIDDPTLVDGGVGLFAGGDLNEVVVEALQLQSVERR